MGILKKIFKPVSKVLDKIIPNEIKPFLPYAAAAFPMLYTGGLGGQTLMQQMLRRAAASGALNIGGQLAQEGNEGDINLLSAGLGALSGVMTAPGTPGVEIGGPANMYGGQPGIPSAAEYFAGKGGDTAMGQIYSGLGKTSKFMTDPGLTKYSIPATQGTADLMYAEGKRLEDDEEEEEVVEEAGYTDAAYRAAIRKSMEAYGADEEEILAAIEAAGYRSGGRVALEFGGIGAAVEKIDDKEMKETMKLAQDMDMPIADLVEEFMIIHKRKPNSLEELKMFYKDKYEYKGPADVKMQETMTERFTAKDGGTPSVLPKGMEADYRGGGFIPIGSKEKADDVPARLSENEFVMTADAVRAAGGGSVNQGAKRMYNLMHNLEARA